MMNQLPPVIRIEPASACNLRCTHCPTGTVDLARGLMKEGVFQRVLSELALNVPPIRVAVLYHGGEPLMNKKFFAMARAVKDVGVPLVKTVSNGMLFRQDTPERIVSSGLDVIEFSLDGQSAQQSDAIRLRSKAETVIANIHRVLQAKKTARSNIKVCVSTTQFRPPEQIGAEPVAPNWLRQEFEGYDDVEFKSTFAMQWPSWAANPDAFRTSDPENVLPPTQCSLLQDTITVRADGSVVICCYDLLSKSVVGNIMDSTLKELWHGPLADVRERFSREDYPEPCSSCAVVTGMRYLTPITSGPIS